GQNVEALEVAGFGDGQQAGCGDFTGCAAIPETDLAPLHAGAKRSFGAVVGGFDALVFHKAEQPLGVLEESRGEIPNLAVATVQVPLGEDEDAFLDGDGTQQQLSPVDPATAKLVPQPEQFGVFRQRVAAKSL